MIQNYYKTYLNILNNIPQYIKDNDSYSTFIYFIQAYYEWMAQENNIQDKVNNIQNYIDIDYTLKEFEQYFFNQFLQNFPEDTIVDKRKLVKFSKELYQRKSTPASFKFLFRSIYNSDCETFESRDYVLKASDGKWATSKTIQIKTLDYRFLQINNYLIIGETSKAVGKIEKTKITGTKIEIFLSDINRDFTSGEFIRIVDSNFQDIILNGTNLRAKVIGLIKQISINNDFVGLNYQPGDPVILYDGLNPNIENPIGATAEVGTVSEGGVSNILVRYGSQGFRMPPYSAVDIIANNGSGATAEVIGLNISKPFLVTDVSIDTIFKYRNVYLSNSSYGFSNNITANANTRLVDALTTPSFITYPIQSIGITNKGTNYTSIPTINVISEYKTDIQTTADLSSLKILGPIGILSNGSGYSVNDVVKFTGGTGAGAYANVTSVDGNGGILSINYVKNYRNNGEEYPIGGIGYHEMPSMSVSSVSGNGAIISANSYLGDGEICTATTDSIGQIKTINIINAGEDYISTPSVSLKIMDFAVANVSLSDIPTQGSKLYQGSANSSTYFATLYSVTPISILDNKYSIRVYNYSGTLSLGESLYIDKNVINDKYYKFPILTDYDIGRYTNGVVVYGNGQAKANATLLTGTTSYDGRYLNADGHLSAYSKLENEIYNNFTYFLNVNVEFNKYKELLYNILNPAGIKVIGKHNITNNDKFEIKYSTTTYSRKENLKRLINSNANGVMILTDSIGSNLIKIYNTDGNLLSTNITSNNKLTIINNSQSFSEVNILVNSILNPEFPNEGNIIYQGDFNSPTFYGILSSVTNRSTNLYQLTLTNCYGNIETSSKLSALLYSDKTYINDKYYTYPIILDSYYPFINGYTTNNNREIFYSTINKVDDSNNTITLDSYNILRFSNVAYGYSHANSLILTDISNNFDLINNGKYHSSQKLKDIVFVGDITSTANNPYLVVSGINYSNNIIYFDSVINSDGDESNPVIINITRNFNSDEIYIEF